MTGATAIVIGRKKSPGSFMEMYLQECLPYSSSLSPTISSSSYGVPDMVVSLSRVQEVRGGLLSGIATRPEPCEIAAFPGTAPLGLIALCTATKDELFESLLPSSTYSLRSDGLCSIIHRKSQGQNPGRYRCLDLLRLPADLQNQSKWAHVQDRSHPRRGRIFICVPRSRRAKWSE